MGSESYIFFFCLFFIFLLISFIIPVGRWLIGTSLVFWATSIIIMSRLAFFSSGNQHSYTTMLTIVIFVTCVLPFSVTAVGRIFYDFYQMSQVKLLCLRDRFFMALILFSILVVFSLGAVLILSA